MNNKIFIGNISPSTNEQDLRDMLSGITEVISVRMPTGMDSKKNAGYAYITLVNSDKIQETVRKFNNTLLKGNKIKVIKAHPIDQDDAYFAKRSRYFRYNNLKRR
ncbi:hypothetical protein A2774_00615 [Candidatus Roizmanbacteria bacterium RIFCSPHIGHO2_01_FULL_39_12c]|uniref:RRM domain-containing protein n=1 Tax=Candidatus Roizmanbacteria bacterium RIFCSPHIGHO2_01_FULL_39_12c TaxID=1802031 RepID=A0A1F7G9X0_9BACT|nr:MAG: hypothetical protein A2774_00615 [Candidatus Roizmanbacteria bacterium RIFCSPHIGHO2_01_FULL_39_12c]OGK47373.1 MAG: hypothetical protein A2963_04535 [Candidatus Roizmanbacteria bacterium RIFCSPLOWO2_01_FULL_40_13]